MLVKRGRHANTRASKYTPLVFSTPSSYGVSSPSSSCPISTCSLPSIQPSFLPLFLPFRRYSPITFLFSTLRQFISRPFIFEISKTLSEQIERPARPLRPSFQSSAPRLRHTEVKVGGHVAFMHAISSSATFKNRIQTKPCQIRSV